MPHEPKPAVRRIRRAPGITYTTQLPPKEGSYRGYGTVPGETLEEFHDRMFDIDPLEATMYEMEVALGRCPISSIEIDQGMTHEEADAGEAAERDSAEFQRYPSGLLL
jgi:hypothetical protein